MKMLHGINVEDAVEEAKDMILLDMHQGVVPNDVDNFGDLHDHVDANEYLLSVTSDLMDDGKLDEACDVGNEISDRLSVWLQERAAKN